LGTVHLTTSQGGARWGRRVGRNGLWQAMGGRGPGSDPGNEGERTGARWWTGALALMPDAGLAPRSRDGRGRGRVHPSSHPLRLRLLVFGLSPQLLALAATRGPAPQPTSSQIARRTGTPRAVCWRATIAFLTDGAEGRHAAHCVYSRAASVCSVLAGFRRIGGSTTAAHGAMYVPDGRRRRRVSGSTTVAHRATYPNAAGEAWALRLPRAGVWIWRCRQSLEVGHGK
jgi:hypothetical protein